MPLQAEGYGISFYGGNFKKDCAGIDSGGKGGCGFIFKWGRKIFLARERGDSILAELFAFLVRKDVYISEQDSSRPWADWAGR